MRSKEKDTTITADRRQRYTSILTVLLLFCTTGVFAASEQSKAFKKLRSKDQEIRLQGAAWISGNAKKIDPDRLLKSAKKYNEVQVKHFLLEALRKNPIPEAGGYAVKLLSHENRRIKQDAAYIVRILSPAGADKKIAKAYEMEKDKRVRRALVYAAGGYSTKSAFTTLESALSDSEKDVAVQAAKELASLNMEKADNLLAGLAESDIPELQDAAKEAKKRIKQRKKAEKRGN